MKTMLFGKMDRDDGGYYQKVSFVIPDDITALEDGYNWLKEKPSFFEKLFEKLGFYGYNEDDDELELTIADLKSTSWFYGLELEFERGDYYEEIHIDADFIEVLEV